MPQWLGRGKSENTAELSSGLPSILKPVTEPSGKHPGTCCPPQACLQELGGLLLEESSPALSRVGGSGESGISQRLSRLSLSPGQTSMTNV